MTARRLVLVETGAHQAGGHRDHALDALTDAARSALVVAPYGVTGESARALAVSGVRVVRPAGVLSEALLTASRMAELVAAAGRRVFASRRWPRMLRRAPHQATLVGRCLAEVACVRTAHREAEGASVVVLTASEALHGAVGLLGGPHIRFVHEVNTTEDLPVRLLGRAAGRGRRAVLALTPTAAVGEELSGRFPGLRVQVRPFAVADPTERLTADERDFARASFGVGDDEAAVCLVGGWWPHKDMDVIDRALGWLDAPLHVLVVGWPLDLGLLKRWSRLPQVRLQVVPGPASPDLVRAVYAAADAALVARRPGIAKESGLVIDAVRLGVPLLLSDHDPALTARVGAADWARTFPAGNSARLAILLSDLPRLPLPRPCPRAAAALGVPTAADQADYLTRLAVELKETPR
ncbi:hypothetical protein [Streptomyces sp. NPDC086782]|uniref:hypothetical protein n=1 Tax=Streptomyces sp. NPDC086782 TaxID=3365757 RepID=UPI0037F3DEA3